MADNKYRSRVHIFVLYPDNDEHVKAIEKISQSYDYAMCLHDRDIDKDGKPKKPHFHIVLRFKQAVWSSALCKELGVEHRFIEDCKRFDNSLQYLIHYNDSDKAQYSIDEVKGNLKTKLVESINKVEKSEGEKVVELIQYIRGCSDKLSITEFAEYCALNGYWAEFRRSGAIFCKMIEEHNQLVRIEFE